MKLKLTVSVILIAVLMAACGASNTPTGEPTPDVAAVRTSAASTVVSQFTLTAAAFTPTPSQPTETSVPEATSTVTIPPLAQVTNAEGTIVALCDSLSIDTATVDVNIPDGTSMSPGQDFVKTWRVKNNGSCPWGAGYELVYAGYSDDMSGQFQPLTEVVQPGQEIEVSVQFQAPDAAGDYLSAWQMSNPAGVTFGEIIFVRITVQ
ncbi:MAG TPA: NBR1-Ig-like domain-containing protein [Anaerolineales bacterium]|nr:NBR1-Ig-like domain-containing protein [Anaerolineales bacterium]